MPVLDDIPFIAKKHQWTYLIGPSGCGKSTLINLTCGLHKPLIGSIKIDNIPLNDISNDEFYKVIHILFQESTLLPWRTIIGNLRLMYDLIGEHVNRHTFNIMCSDQLEAVDMVYYKNYYPSQISGGMKQKVMIARALLSQAEYLLLDEPFSAIDYINRRKLCLLLEKLLLQKKMTILNVSHDIQEALRFADRIVIMSEKPSKVVEIIENDTDRSLRDINTTDLGQKQEYILKIIKNEKGD